MQRPYKTADGNFRGLLLTDQKERRRDNFNGSPANFKTAKRGFELKN